MRHLFIDPGHPAFDEYVAERRTAFLTRNHIDHPVGDPDRIEGDYNDQPQSQEEEWYSEQMQ